jgi:hypothetical protein
MLYPPSEGEGMRYRTPPEGEENNICLPLQEGGMEGDRVVGIV